MTTAPVLRAGTADRERTGRHLGTALTLGYLTLDEYDDRMGRAMLANSAVDLERLTADLPRDRLRRHDPHTRARRAAAARLGVRIHLAAYLAMALVVTVVWVSVALAADVWYPWLIWPILGGALGVLGHAVPVRMYRRARAR